MNTYSYNYKVQKFPIILIFKESNMMLVNEIFVDLMNQTLSKLEIKEIR